MKEQILALLRERDDYVSGQELCSRFGVSRTAVWKAMGKLKEAGYEIEAVPNRGYRLVAFPDSVAAVEVLSRMETKVFGRDVRYFETIDTTNRYAKRLGEEGVPEGALVIADEQTAGKGRSGRHWVTPKGSTIAMTLLLRPKLAVERISMVTLVMGMAVARALRENCHVDAMIKWPNDVVVDGKKICGILTEMSAEMMAVNYIVIGVGINTNLTQFPEELKDKATSLALLLGKNVERAPLIAAVMKEFEELYNRFLMAGDLQPLQDEYNALLVNTGRIVRVLDPAGEYTGEALGIDERGRLLVRPCDAGATTKPGLGADQGADNRSSDSKPDFGVDEIRRVYAGEVSVRGIYGYV